MAQSSKQIQEQKLEQKLTLSQQQLLFVRLLELPTEALEERIRSEVLENPALEEINEHDAESSERYENSPLEDEDTDNESDGEEITYAEEPNDNLALGDYRTEDDIPDYLLRTNNTTPDEKVEEIPFSDTVSFYEILKEQLGECTLPRKEQNIAEYLIGSLDDDGLLRKELTSIADELSIYHGIETNEHELSRILEVIQGLEPAGIGGRNLQECLLLQLSRKPDSDMNRCAQNILERCYDDFTHKRWEHIMQRLSLNETEFKEALDELLHLNPRPGSSLGETMDKHTQAIVPDFIVEIDENNHISFCLNDNQTPMLTINPDFNQMMKEYEQSKNPTKATKEAMLFLKQKVDSAQNFINAIEQREHTLTVTMQAIIKLQQAFFLEGDEQLLVPMKLKDVAKIAGVDISTVSRVSNCKYVQTEFGIFPLKFFFGDSYKKPIMLQSRHSSKNTEEEKKKKDEEITSSEEKEEKSIRQIRATILECVENEDKESPLTDEELMKILKEKGFDLARRTIAKYRKQLGIPVARMRR